jgi:hypothetical protein
MKNPCGEIQSNLEFTLDPVISDLIYKKVVNCKLETLDMLRSNYADLHVLTNDQLIDLYSTFSETFYSASWITPNHHVLNKFYNWATKSPLQLLIEEL